MYSHSPIALDKAVALFPALAGTPAETTSDRYEHIPTIKVLEALGREGFNVHGITGIRSRTAERKMVSKHVVRMRREADIGKQEANEVLLINSHDGTSSYQMRAGVIRFICSNGLIVGDFFASTKVKHMGAGTVGKVIEGTYEVVNEFPKVTAQVEAMKAISLNRDEQRALAKAALLIRYDGNGVEVQPDRILAPQRREDTSADIWTTFNTIQEHVIRGGARGIVTDENGNRRRASMRAVNSIDGNTNMNRALWTLAAEMAKIKQAA